MEDDKLSGRTALNSAIVAIFFVIQIATAIAALCAGAYYLTVLWGVSWLLMWLAAKADDEEVKK